MSDTPDKPARSSRVALGIAGAVMLLFGAVIGAFMSDIILNIIDNTHPNALPNVLSSSSIPKSIRIDTPQTAPDTFALNAENSELMIGSDDPVNERFTDIIGNYYTGEFNKQFSYEKAPEDGGPEVRVRYDAIASTFRGRIEGRRLKPNFVYQIKLMGNFNHRDNFETIGRVGRWRLPGGGTNFTDDDYRHYTEKDMVEAYVYFDFFVTDKDGNGRRDFELTRSLHVTWSTIQRSKIPEEHVRTHVIDSRSSDTYARPKINDFPVGLWAERELPRYGSEDQIIRLPVGEYKAVLALTEESFHANDADGGFWATVYHMPLHFTIKKDEKPATP